MSAAQIWSTIDPAAQFRVAPEGYGDGGADPSRQTVDATSPIWHPNHPQFVFGVVAAATVGLLYYVFEHGGAGAGGKAHVGPVKADAEIGIGGSKK